MKDQITNNLLLSLTFSFFGLLLIFGLGFVFPEVNPYTAIKWIVIVCAVVFFYAILDLLVRKIIELKGKVNIGKGIKRLTKKSSK
jgi:hypothetical protein